METGWVSCGSAVLGNRVVVRVSVLASNRLIAVSQAFVGQRQALLSVDEAVPRAAWCIFPPASLAFLR